MPGVLTWLGHSTVLIELGGARLITDPLLRPRVAHLLREVPEPADLGRLDAILISHGHHDHLDPASLRRLDPDAAVVAPPAAARSLRGSGRTVHTLERRRRGRARRGARGGGAGRPRRPPDPGRPAVERRRLRRRRRLLRRRHRAVPGDGETWRARSTRRCVPISGWGPKTGPGHMDPREAAEALALLRPALAVPIHWGTYRRIGHQPSGDPAREFEAHAAELAPDVRVAVLAPGGSVEITRAV